MHARLDDPAADGKRAEPLAPVAPVTGKPARALLDDLAHPMERFHVVLERRAPEETDLRHIGRPQPRLTAFALDRLDHRRLFAADVRAGAAAKMNLWQRARRIRLERRNLAFEDGAAAVILVAEVNVDRVDADGPRRDQRALDESMRIAL